MVLGLVLGGFGGLAVGQKRWGMAPLQLHSSLSESFTERMTMRRLPASLPAERKLRLSLPAVLIVNEP